MDRTRIMLFGTFDLIHPGHLHLFKQARKLAKNPFLIVSIARDSNVKKIKEHLPKNSQSKRQQQISKVPLVDKVVLGGARSHIPHIIKERPDIIALGYDQTAYTKGLCQDLAARGLKVKIIRLKPHKPHIYKTSLLLKRPRK